MKLKLEEKDKPVDMAKAIGDINKSITTKEILKKKVWREALELAKKQKLPIRLLDKNSKVIEPTSPLCRSILEKLTTTKEGDYWSYLRGEHKLTREEVFHVGGNCEFCQRLYAAHKRGALIGVKMWKPEREFTPEEKARLHELDQQKLNEQLGEISEEEEWLQMYESEVPEEKE